MLLTDYITTRWYRAPEVMISWADYTSAIDVWAVGCIFAEMILGKPLFEGYDECSQIEIIMKILGPEAEQELHEFMAKDDAKLDFSDYKNSPKHVQTFD